jgi:hypothetical protein
MCQILERFHICKSVGLHKKKNVIIRIITLVNFVPVTSFPGYFFTSNVGLTLYVPAGHKTSLRPGKAKFAPLESLLPTCSANHLARGASCRIEMAMKQLINGNKKESNLYVH